MFKIAISYMRGYKKNSIMVIMGIAFSVMLMFSLIQMGDSILKKFIESIEYAAKVDFEVKNLDNSQLSIIEDAINKNELLERIDSYLKTSWYATTYLNNDLTVGQVVGVEGDISLLWNINFIEGAMPKEEYDIVLEKSYLDNINKKYKLGEKIILQIYDEEGNSIEKEFKISGIIEDVSNDIATKYLITTYKTSLDIQKNKNFIINNKYNSVQILVEKNKYDIEKNIDLSMKIKELLNIENEKFIKEHYKENTYKSEMYEEKGIFYSVGYSFKGLSLIIAICMFVFVFNTVNINIIEKIRQYGTMRCIGLSKKQLLKLLFIEGAFYSFFGISIGIILGNIMNFFIGNKIVSLIIVEDFNIKIIQNLSSYVLVIIISIISILIAMIKIIRSIGKLSPINTLNYSENKNCEVYNKRKIEEGKLIYELAKRNLKITKVKSRTLLITLIISSGLLFIMVNLLFSVNYEAIDDGKNTIGDYEMSSNIYNENFIGKNEVESLRNRDVINEIYGQTLLSEYICESIDGGNKNIQLVIYDDNLFAELIKRNNKLKNINYIHNEVAVVSIPKNFSEEINGIKIKATDYLLENNKNAISEYEIKSNYIVNSKSLLGGISINEDNYVYLIINEKLGRKLLGTDEYGYSNIIVREGSNKEKLDKVFFTSFFSQEFLYKDLNTSMNKSDKQILGIIILALYIVVSTLVLSFLIINNTIKANVTSRVKENGILRALGMTKNCLYKIMNMENIIISIKAIIISSIVTIPINIHFHKVIYGESELKLSAYIMVIIFIIISTNIISKISIKKACKHKIVEMIREE